MSSVGYEMIILMFLSCVMKYLLLLVLQKFLRKLSLTWYLLSILDTQPCETRSCLEMTQGRTPAAAISTIFSLIWFGRGRPLMNKPPSWLTRPCPISNFSLEFDSKWQSFQHINYFIKRCSQSYGVGI